MNAPTDFQLQKIPLKHGPGAMPAIGFGTLIPDAATTRTAVHDALT
jgi:alcohol dehydrogenase (NADP+)